MPAADSNSPAGVRWRSRARAAIFVSTAAGLASIALSHFALGTSAAFAAVGRARLRLPPIWIPLAFFLGWTLVSMAASGDPAAGLPQVKKLFVFLILPLVYTLTRSAADGRRMFEAWVVVCSTAAALAVGQFCVKWRAAQASGEDFLAAYAPDRVTGFFSHWMTFSQAAMLVFVLLGAYLLFSPASGRGRPIWTAAAALLGAGLALSFTRGVWLGTAVAAVYLVWVWNKRLLWAIPAAAVIGAFAAPEPMQRRLRSIADPSANQARLIMWRTGARMIADRPLLGVGPERVGALFDRYRPSDVEALPDAYYGHLHSIYVHYAAERGLPALGALLWLLLKVPWDLRRALRRAPPGLDDRRFLAHGAIAATLAVMTVGCFDLTLGDSEVLGTYLAVLALGYRAAEGSIAAVN